MPTTEPVDLRVITSVPVEIPAVLRLVPENPDFPSRPATTEDLNRMGWRHTDQIYDRVSGLFEKMGINPQEGRGSLVRYFIEYAYMYSHDMDADDLARCRALILGEDVPDYD